MEAIGQKRKETTAISASPSISSMKASTPAPYSIRLGSPRALRTIIPPIPTSNWPPPCRCSNGQRAMRLPAPCGRNGSICRPGSGPIRRYGPISRPGCDGAYGRLRKGQNETIARARPGVHRPRLTPKASAQAHQPRPARAVSWSLGMCGIAGMVDWRAATAADALRSIADAMIETVRHRGPDAGEVWVEAEGGVALGQRRLAIIDLSPGGAQPMHSADRRFVITFNGEIYNYRDIRSELQAAGHPMRSDSDTEVLLDACALCALQPPLDPPLRIFPLPFSA